MFVFQAVHVNTEREILGGLILIELALEQNRIGTEIDIAFLGDEALDDLGHIGMDQRLAAGNTDDRCAAFLGCRPTLFGCQTLIEDVVGVLDLAASGAGQIATEERFQHEDQGISLHPFEFLGEDIAGNRVHLRKRNSHD